MDGETVFAVLLGAALAVFSLVMAGYPVLRDAFFRPARLGDGDAGPAEPGDDGDVGLAAIYDSIDTLELEYQLGNLPEAEYRRQLQAYRMEAAAVVKAQVERGDLPFGQCVALGGGRTGRRGGRRDGGLPGVRCADSGGASRGLSGLRRSSRGEWGR